MTGRHCGVGGVGVAVTWFASARWLVVALRHLTVAGFASAGVFRLTFGKEVVTTGGATVAAVATVAGGSSVEGGCVPSVACVTGIATVCDRFGVGGGIGIAGVTRGRVGLGDRFGRLGDGFGDFGDSLSDRLGRLGDGFGNCVDYAEE